MTGENSTLRYKLGQDPNEMKDDKEIGKGMKLREKVVLKNKCQFVVGELCKPHSCEICLNMLGGKKVETRETEKMEIGLFGGENIKQGDYITKYTGKVTKNKLIL